MKQKLLIALCATTLLGACAATMNTDGASGAMGTSMSSSANTKMVGGAAMLPSKDIVDNAVNSKDHTTLVAAVKAAGLVDTLKTADALPHEMEALNALLKAQADAAKWAVGSIRLPRHQPHCCQSNSKVRHSLYCSVRLLPPSTRE